MTKAMKKTTLLSIVLICLGIYSYSQGTLTGKIIDSSSKTPLGLATVSVFRAVDTVLLTYRLSNPDGELKVPGLPLNIQCRVVISFSGYGVYRKEFTLTNDKPTEHLGTVYMFTDAKSLDEVLVIAERPPVIIKKDTIEFNASAFKTLPNALVEDLLKKLPGVQVDRDGNIMVNGRPVNRILVDGKTFFGDDPKMATRNLPANAIEKVQVTDDKDEMMRNGDDNMNNVGKVINITLKKGVKKGWFGKLYGGAGTEKLYEAGGIANIYRDTMQLSVLGYMNNMNKAGFSYTELMQAGGFERNRSNSNSNSTSIWNNSSGGSSVSLNGINFGGIQQGGGVSTSKGAGFNLNHAPNLKRSFYLQYFHGNVLVDRTTRTTMQQFTNDTVVNNGTVLTGDVLTNAHNIGIGARLKPDSVTNILINANYQLANINEDRFSDVNVINSKIGPVSNGDIDQDNRGRIRYYRHNISVNILSKTKKGRRFTVNQSLDINNRFNNNETVTELNVLYPTVYDSLNAQLRREAIKRTDATLNFNYSEPIAKQWTLRVGGRYEFGDLTNDIGTFNKGGGSEYTELNPEFSSLFDRISHRIIFTPGIEFKWKDLTITPSVRALFQDVDNKLASLNTSIRQKQNNILPSMQINYKQLNLNYGRDVQLPYYSYLIPVRDNTNSYYIVNGNPDLKTVIRDNFSLNYNLNNAKRNLYVSVYANYGYTKRDIIQSIALDSRGVQTSTPINANGTTYLYTYFNVNKQYKRNPKFNFSWNTGGNIGKNHNRIFFNDVSAWQTQYNFNVWVGLMLNWNDKVELNSTYGPSYSSTEYTTSKLREINITYQWLENEFILRWPKRVIWETQTNYTFNSAAPQGTPKGILRWNAAFNLTMLKDDVGVLKVSVFDILDRNRNITSYAYRNVLFSSQTNALPQYFMVTFTYNVRAAGVKKKVGGRERLFFF
jgi:hypothetical protein